MIKILTFSLCLLMMQSALSQVRYTPSNRGDSIWHKGKYYSKEDFKSIQAELDKYEFDTYLMPGVAFAYFQPKAKDSLGTLSGVAVEYLLWAAVRQTDASGPSHSRVYAKFNILNSSKSGISPMFLYAAGFDLSIEKNPKRTFLVPYFGLEVGGISQKQFGTTAQFTPTLGLHLFSKKNLFVNLHGGYVYPIKNFESLRGWTMQAGLNFSFW